MSIIDYFKKGDFTELLPYIRRNKDAKLILRSLSRLSLYVNIEHKPDTVDDFIEDIDPELDIYGDMYKDFSSGSDYPSSPEGKRLINAFTYKYRGVLDDDDIQMMQSAAYIYVRYCHNDANPKSYLINYNRQIAKSVIDDYESIVSSKADFIIILTTSSQYALTEDDAIQIKKYLYQINGTRNVSIHLLTDDQLGDSIKIDSCKCGRGSTFFHTSNNYGAQSMMAELFDYGPEMMFLSQSDIDRMFNQCNICEAFSITAQNSMEEISKCLRDHLPYFTSPNARRVIMCIEFPRESDSTYDNIMEVSNTIEELFPKASILWGTRVDEELSEFRLTLLVDIPDDFLYEYSQWDEV